MDAWVASRDEQLKVFRLALEKVDALQKAEAEGHLRPDVVYVPGDLVWITVRPISHHGQAVEAKVATRWHGPARVVSRSGVNHYDLDYNDEEPPQRYGVERLKPYVAVRVGPLEVPNRALGFVPRPRFSCD